MLNTTKKPLRAASNSKNWSQAVERYNLPVGGIEIQIEGRSISKLDTINAVTRSTSHESHKQDKFDTPSPLETPKLAFSSPLNPCPRLPVPKKRSPLYYLASRSLLVIGTLAIIGNIPVHSKIYLNTEPTVPLLNAEAEAALKAEGELIELELPDAADEIYSGSEGEVLPAANEGKWSIYEVELGDTLADVYNALKLKGSLADLTDDPDIHKTFAKLKPESRILVQVDEGKVQQIIYATGKRSAYIVALKNGVYTGQQEKELFEFQENRAGFKVDKPFHFAAEQAHLPVNITNQLSKIFKGDVDFRRLSINDRVSVIFEDFFYQGERIITHHLLAAEFEHRGQIYQRIRFMSVDGKTRYLQPDADMELKQVAFNRYPLRAGRLSSGFGTRRHPVLGYSRMHTGTDFAAPHGTPIYATGSGTVRYVGRKGGYGKTIELSHDDDISTLYGHMSEYKEGLNRGDTVKRGDIIGYVGSTGTSTGNHVHYEFRINGAPQDPLTIALPTTGILTPKEVKEFRTYAHTMKNQLQQMRETAINDLNQPAYGG